MAECIGPIRQVGMRSSNIPHQYVFIPDQSFENEARSSKGPVKYAGVYSTVHSFCRGASLRGARCSTHDPRFTKNITRHRARFAGAANLVWRLDLVFVENRSNGEALEKSKLELLWTIVP